MVEIQSIGPVQVPGQSETWSDLLEAIPGAFLVANDAGRYVFANAAACSVLQRDSKELLGLTVFDLARDGDTSAATWSEFQGSGALAGEFDILLPDGDVRTLHYEARTSFRPGLHISIVRDISDEKRLTARARESEAFFVCAFNASPVPMNIRLLSTGVFVETNAAFLECTGFWRSEVIGRTSEALGLWENPEIVRGLLRQVRQSEGTVRARGILRTKSGERRDYSVALRRCEVSGTTYAVSSYSDMALL